MSGPKENERKPRPEEIIPNTPPPRPKTLPGDDDAEELPPTAPAPPKPAKKAGDRRSIPPREDPPLVISRTRGADQHGHWGITSMVHTLDR